MEYLQVYLHIIEARDIKGVGNNGNLDPYIQVMAPNENGKLQELYKTKILKSTNNPNYNVELVVRVPSTTDNITLKLKDWKMFLKDKTLGVVVLPLNRIPNRPNVEDHAIEGCDGKLKLCIRAMRRLTDIPERIVEECPKVRIHLEQSIYYPGEVVRGHLIFTDRKELRDGERGHIWFYIATIHEGVSEALDLNVRFDIIQGASSLWAFQFLLPKKFAIDHRSSRFSEPKANLSISVYAPTEFRQCAKTKFIVLPYLEELEPSFSPRRPEPPPIAPCGLTLTWVDLPKIHYQDSTDLLKFNLHNTGTSSAKFESLNVSLKYQRIVTQFDENSEIALISKEKIATHSTVSLGPITLGPSETTQLTFLLPQPERPSAPFEMSGEFYELNYFLEVEGEVLGGERVGISRKPIFYTSKSLTRETPPNHELSMAPDTLWVAAVDDPDLVYTLMAPSIFALTSSIYANVTYSVSEPVPTEIFSTLRRETMTRLPPQHDDLPPRSIFDVPFRTTAEWS